MKHTKRTLTILISIVLLILSANALIASADTEYRYSDIWMYTLENGEAIIQGIETEDQIPATVNIPENLDGYPVTTIEWVSAYGDTVCNLFIPESVTKIENVDWTAIGYGFKSITVDKDNPVFTSEDGVLFNKDKTVLLRYPTGNSANSYTIPAGVTTIDRYAFSDSCNLTDVTISGNVETIGYAAFSDSSNLKSVTIGDSVKTIDEAAFRWCSGIENVSIGNGVTTIGFDAFRGCESLKTLTIPTSVTSIGEYALFGCDSIKSISIPESVASIGECALMNCNSLTKIEVAETNANYSSSEDGVLFNKSKTELIQYPIGNERTSYIIPDSVTTINTCAFCSCENLTSVTIPEGVTTIEESAFDNCENITSISFPDSVTTIGDWAFYYCDNLSDISFGKGLKTIGECAFYQCRSLTTVSLPDGITSVGFYSFCWTPIKEIYIPASIENLDYHSFEHSELTNIYFEGSKNDWNKINFITDPEDADYDNNGNPFVIDMANIHYNHDNTPVSGSCSENISWYYNGIGTLTISGNGAMPKYHKGENAPWNEFASAVATLRIEEGITQIDGFYNCTNIDTVILPESLEYVESCAFCWDINNDVSVTYGGMPEDWSDIKFGTHESDACSCYCIDGAVYIDNENFSIDTISLSADSTTVRYGETVTVVADVPTSEDESIYFLPVGTDLYWYGNYEGFFSRMIYIDNEYWCDMTSEFSGTTELTVRLENIYNDDVESIEATIELTSKADFFDRLIYIFRILFHKILSFFSF